jgi:ubiquinone/menaquinone biosynthesis C-methylase UbiE
MTLTSQGFYEQEASQYDSRRWLTPAGQLISNVQRDILRDFATEVRNKQVLEIGAGTGRFTEVLLEQDNDVIAFDISNPMLQKLRQRLKSHPNYKLLRTILGDARIMGVESSSVDAIVCFNALSHIPEHKRVFHEIQRVLRPGGLFLFNIPNYLSLYYPIGLYVKWREKSVTRNVYTMWYDPKKIMRQLKIQGFKIMDIKGQLHVPTMTPPILLQLVRYIDGKMRNGKSLILAPIIYIKAQKLIM